MLHSIDPRVKLVSLAMILSAVLIIGEWIGMIPIAILISIMWIISRSSLSQLIRDVFSLSVLYIITILLHSFLTPGEALFDFLFGIPITVEGVQKGLFFSAKIACLAVIVGLVLRATHQSEWAKAVEALLPGKGVFSRFAIMLGLTVRFFPMILEEANRIRLAQIGRGLGQGGNLFKRVKNLIPVLLPLLSASLRKADSITYNMRSRGFVVDEDRSYHNPLILKITDVFYGLLTAVTILLSFFLLLISG